MKRSIITFTIVLGILVCALCCYLVIVPRQHQKEQQPLLVSTLTEDASAVIKPLRERITFILGEDREADNRYYAEAQNYYTHHPVGRTEYLVATCRSLLEVRDYLEQHQPANGLPWGVVNLVSHGNPWTGLSVRVTPDIKRTTAEKLEACIANGTWKLLPQTVVDEHTEIILHGCGVGKNQRLVNALALAFGSSHHQPVVRASKLFEYYASRENNEKLETERYLADTWMESYKMGERPANALLMNTLRENYPQAAVDWAGALSREQPRWVGDSYYYTFEIPVKWILKLSHDSIPHEATQLAWIARQHDIAAELDQLQMPYDRFSWSFTGIYTSNEDGSRSPAIWVKGYCTVLTVLQALTSTKGTDLALSRPFEPALDDSGYYTTAHTWKTGNHASGSSSYALCEL